MSIKLVRHTRPKIEDGICYGRLDLPVAESFKADALDVIDGLQSAVHLVTSPMLRCRMLADEIGKQFDRVATVDDRLAEMDFGDWEGMPWADVPRIQLDEWAEDFMYARPHGGENVATLLARTNSAIDEYQRLGESTIIVTHAGVIRAALSTGEHSVDWQVDVSFGQIIELPKIRDHRKSNVG